MVDILSALFSNLGPQFMHVGAIGVGISIGVLAMVRGLRLIYQTIR